MTQEQAEKMSATRAIEILTAMREMMCDPNGCPVSDAYFALDKAIEAMQNAPTVIEAEE